MKALAKVEFDNIFLFKYSIRPGTPAAEFKDQVAEEVKSRRFDELMSLQKGITERKNQALMGATLEVLVEGPSPKNLGKLTGRREPTRWLTFTGHTDWSGKRCLSPSSAADYIVWKGRRLKGGESP